MNKKLITKLIKIGSASIGLLCVVLIFFMAYTLGCRDNFYPESDRLYQLMDRYESVNYSGVTNIVVQPIGPAMMDDFTEVESATVVRRWSDTFEARDNYFKKSFIFTDSLFFDVLPRPILLGNKEDFFRSAFSIVVTKSLAEEIWGTIDVLGETLKNKNQDVFEVKGVIEDWPENSSIKQRLLVSFESLFKLDYYQTSWTHGDSFIAYLRLAKGGSPSSFTYDRFLAFQRKYFDVDKEIEKGMKSNYFLTPLQDVIFLDEDSEGVIAYIYFGLGVFFLVLVLFNLYLLSQAQFKSYEKELEVRRVNGASVSQLYSVLSLRVLKEIITICLLMVCLYLLFASGFKSYFSIDLMLLTKEEYLILAELSIVVLFLLFLFSGVIPSIGTISKIKRHQLKRKQHTKELSVHVPLILQLGISFVFLVSSLFMNRQLEYIQTFDRGYDVENLVSIPLNSESLMNKAGALRSEIGKLTGVDACCLANTTLTNGLGGGQFSLNSEGTDSRICRFLQMDNNFTSTMRMKVDGEGFAERLSKDEVMINEKAAKSFQLKNPIGSLIYQNGKPLTVVGVFNDFVTGPWYGAEPCVAFGFSPAKNSSGHLIVRLNKQSEQASVEEIEKIFNSLYPANPFVLSYYSQMITPRQETRLGTLFSFFTLVALLLTCVGLIGQSLVRVNESLKEIGIRRVNGASVFSVLGLLNRIEIIRIIVAVVLFVPVASLTLFYGGYANYAYHATVGWTDYVLLFLLFSLSVLFIVSITVLRSVNANPTSLLQSE